MAYGKGLLGRINLRNYDLLPLVVIMGFVGCMATAASWRAMMKTDVAWSKRSNPHPWLKVPSTQRHKLITYRQKYEANPAVEKLRKEIGSS